MNRHPLLQQQLANLGQQQPVPNTPAVDALLNMVSDTYQQFAQLGDEQPINTIEVMDLLHHLPGAYFRISTNGTVNFHCQHNNASNLLQQAELGLTIEQYFTPNFTEHLQPLITQFNEQHTQQHSNFSVLLHAHTANENTAADTQLYDVKLCPLNNAERLLAVTDISYQLASSREQKATQLRIQKQNQALLELTEALDNCNNLDNALEQISRVCAQTLNTSRAGVWVFNSDATQIECKNEYDIHSQQYLAPQTMMINIHPEYFTALANNRVRATSDAINHTGNTAESYRYLKENKIYSMLDAPIKADGLYLGILRLYQKTHIHTWQLDEQQFAASIADIIALVHQKNRREAALTALNESENRFKALAESTGSAIFAFREQIIYANNATEQLTGLDQEALKILPINILFGSSFAKAFNLHTLETKANSSGVEIEFSRSSGEIRWAYINVTKTNYTGQSAWLASAFDITERKRAEIQMRYQAFHDNLTSLPNRALLVNKLDVCLTKASRDRYYRFAICQISLHNIKTLNDNIGHANSDHFLIDFALRCKRACSISDTLTKISDDTFVLVRENIPSLDDVVSFCKTLQQTLNQTISIDENDINCPFSIGIVYCDRLYRSSDELLRNAAIAIEQATQLSGAPISVFNEAANQSMRQKKELASRLRKALNNNELNLRYWPITTHNHNTIQFIEPLIHWREGDACRLNEGHFLLTKSDQQFMYKVARWLINQVVNSEVFQEGETPIWFNVSQCGINTLELLIETINLIGNGQKKLSHIASVIELAPELAVQIQHIHGLQAALQKNQCQLALDITHITLEHLHVVQSLPLSFVKIQSQMGAGPTPSGPVYNLLNSLISYCHSMGLGILIDGINEPQLLASPILSTPHGTVFMQGLAIAHPMLACDLIKPNAKTANSL